MTPHPCESVTHKHITSFHVGWQCIIIILFKYHVCTYEGQGLSNSALTSVQRDPADPTAIHTRINAGLVRIFTCRWFGWAACLCTFEWVKRHCRSVTMKDYWLCYLMWHYHVKGLFSCWRVCVGCCALVSIVIVLLCKALARALVFVSQYSILGFECYPHFAHMPSNTITYI